MVAQAGQDILVKADFDGNGSFVTVAGLRSSKIAFNAQTIATTNAQSLGRWRELLEGGGVKSANIVGAGVFVDEQSDAKLRAAFFAGELLDLNLILPDFGLIRGQFQISALEYSGNYDAEMLFEFSLASASEIEFVAEVETIAE